MKQSEQLFGELLTEAIREISKYESKSMAIVQDELGHAIGKKGKSSIEKWRVGARPSKSNDVAGLAREIMKRIRKDRGWLETFCDAGGYPNSTSLLDELLPIPRFQLITSQTSARYRPVPICPSGAMIFLWAEDGTCKL